MRRFTRRLSINTTQRLTYSLPSPSFFFKLHIKHLKLFFSSPTLNHDDQTYESAFGEEGGIIISPLSPNFPKYNVFTLAILTFLLLFIHASYWIMQRTMLLLSNYILVNLLQDCIILGWPSKAHYVHVPLAHWLNFYQN